MRNTTSEFLTARLRNFRGVNFAIDIVRVVNISCASYVISKQAKEYHTAVRANRSAPAIALTRARRRYVTVGLALPCGNCLICDLVSSS